MQILIMEKTRVKEKMIDKHFFSDIPLSSNK